MARTERVKLIEELQTARGGRVCIAYVTSTRPGHEIQIADDVVRRLHDHLEAKKEEAKSKGVDLFLHSNGGSGTAPWRLVSLIREFTDKFSVLIPHHAFSAGTLISLGADEIIMHRLGCLGPIDPSVANIFNPPHPFNPSQPAPISVEDVTSYFKLVKNDVGIKHEDELIQAVRALTDKVHPLALGNVQRHHQQSRMMATNLLRQHMGSDRDHEISEIIDHLKSNISFHGHPISRGEAKKDLKLKVVVPPENIENLMWKLYLEYEKELKITEPFMVAHEIDARQPAQATPPPTVAQVAQQMTQLAAAGIGLNNVAPAQFAQLAAAMVPLVTGAIPASNKVKIDGMKGAYLESTVMTESFLTDLSLERVGDTLKQEVRWARWEKEV